MTSLIHIGDFHAAAGPRNADRYRALDQIIAEALALPHLGAFLWPGDLFDAASSVEDRNAIDERLVRMATAGPVVIVPGNHDRPGDLDGFARLKGGYPIYVVDTPHCLRIRLATGENATIFCLPYPQKAGLVGAGVTPDGVVATAADVLEPIFMVAAAELETARAAGDLTLMIGHVNVAGSITSSGQPNIGKEIELSPRHLDRLGPIYKGLNHIHKPQDIAGACYAGSVCRMDYGETEEKSYIRVNMDPGGSYLATRHPIAIAPMFHIEGTLTRDGFIVGTDNEDVFSRVSANDWAGCDVRVRYTYHASERAVINEKHVWVLFASALRLKVEGVAIADRELRSPEVAAARTFADKIAAYRKERTLPPSVAEKVAALETQSVEELLAAVETRLAAIEQREKVQAAA